VALDWDSADADSCAAAGGFVEASAAGLPACAGAACGVSAAAGASCLAAASAGFCAGSAGAWACCFWGCLALLPDWLAGPGRLPPPKLVLLAVDCGLPPWTALGESPLPEPDFTMLAHGELRGFAPGAGASA